ERKRVLPRAEQPFPRFRFHEVAGAVNDREKVEPVAADEALEVAVRGQPHLMASRLQPEPEGDVRPHIAERTGRRNGDPHGSHLLERSRVNAPAGPLTELSQMNAIWGLGNEFRS